MKLRVRLVILFVTMISVPTAVILTMTFANVENLILTKEAEELDVLAEVKEQQIQSNIRFHTEYLKELAFHYPFRDLLSEYRNLEDDGRIRDEAHDILNRTEQVHKEDSYQSIKGKVALYSTDGLLGSNFTPTVDENEFIESLFSTLVPEEVSIYYNHSLKQLLFVYPFEGEEQLLGYLVELVHTEEVIREVTDYYGLGETGEILLAFKNEQGDVEFINTLRFEDDSNARLDTQQADTAVSIISAIRQIEDTQVDTVDYRGVRVISATRYVPELDWGIVVKKDRAESVQAFIRLKQLLVFVALCILSLSAVMSFVIATSISLPLITLTNVTKAFGEKVTPHIVFPERLLKDTSELGSLAKSFQVMTGSVFRTKQMLEAQVSERTQKLLQRQELSEEIEAATHIGSWEYHFESEEMYWSDEMYRLHGVEPGTLIPTFELLLKFVHPDDREHDIAAFSAAIETTGMYKHNKRLVLSFEEFVEVHAEAKVIFDDSKQPVRMFGWYKKR